MDYAFSEWSTFVEPWGWWVYESMLSSAILCAQNKKYSLVVKIISSFSVLIFINRMQRHRPKYMNTRTMHMQSLISVRISRKGTFNCSICMYGKYMKPAAYMQKGIAADGYLQKWLCQSTSQQ